MARSDPRKLRTPKLSGAIIVDSYRGQARVRSWPKKTGRPKSPAVRQQNDWIKATTQIWKAIPASQQKAAREQTAGTGLYPRDIFTMAMSGGLMDLLDEDGTLIRFRRHFVRRVMFQGCILRQTANQSFADVTTVPIQWPLPELDTAGFYQITAPAQLKVPPGVSVITASAGMTDTGGANADRCLLQITRNGDVMAQTIPRVTSTFALNVKAGPFLVEENDIIQAEIFAIGFSSATNGPRTWMSIQILGAEV